MLFYIEHAIQDASLTRSGERRVVSKRMLYVELDADGTTRHVHYAPYLDYRPLAEGEPGVEAILDRPECAWIDREIEQKAQGYAVAQVVPEHLKEVRDAKLKLIAKTEVAVKDRLTKEITYWDHRAEQLKLQEQAGKPNAKLNSDEARKRADNLQGRLQKRLEELKLEAQISPLPPVVLGGLLVVPAGLLAAMTGRTPAAPSAPVDTQASAARARAIVMAIERNLGFEPTDREFEKLGYDIESRVPGTGKLRFIEVKGRVTGADTITVTRNEILYSLNKPDDFILAIVEFLDGDSHRVHYLRQPFGARAGLRGDERELRLCGTAGPCRGAGMNKPARPPDYAELLKEIKDRIGQAQTRAILTVNAELVRLYWDIGQLIDNRQRREGWGAAVIPRLARELKNELPEEKGFSERNIKRMLAFYRAYPNPSSFVPQPAALMPSGGEHATTGCETARDPNSAAACGTIHGHDPLGDPLVPSRRLDGKGERRGRTPLVHAANARQRLEPELAQYRPNAPAGYPAAARRQRGSAGLWRMPANAPARCPPVNPPLFPHLRIARGEASRWRRRSC